MQENPNPWLIARLFDFSFTHFVALSLIRIVYFLFAVIGLAGLAYAIFVLYQIGQAYPELLLIDLLLALASPFLYLFYLLVLRLICESLIVIFTMAEHLRELAEAARQAKPAAIPAAPASE